MAKTLSPTEMIARELEHFLEDKEPGVVCLRGRWGVGKTHTWNMALKAVKARMKLGLQVYSPVSLFGIGMRLGIIFMDRSMTTKKTLSLRFSLRSRSGAISAMSAISLG